jgi:hypothetical protein
MASAKAMARIDGFRGFHADETHANRRAQRGQPDMYVSGHLCQHWH